MTDALQPDVKPLDLECLTYAGMVACGRVVRGLGEGASSSEAAAEHIVQYFYDTFRVPRSGERACALVRCFQTVPFERLEGFRRTAAQRALKGRAASPAMRCLSLLATRGIEPAWNSPSTSSGHAAIPLPSVEVVQQAPMIARLIRQMGFAVEHLVAPASNTALDLEASSRNFGVFHVERARNSSFIPAQASFVKPYGVRSVVGMGGLLPDGELFAVILFSRVSISPEVATLFRTLALNVKLSLLPFRASSALEGTEA